MNDDEAEIRGLFDQWMAALRATDVAARTERYTSDVVLFDVVNPLRHQGVASLRQRLAEWFSTFDGPVDSEVRDLSVTAGVDVAFCHCLNRFRGTKTAGGRLDMWVRFTVGFRKVDGRWMVTHEHASVPFDVTTGLASVDLTP